jgi:SAM-dependent methyltransferase
MLDLANDIRSLSDLSRVLRRLPFVWRFVPAPRVRFSDSMTYWERRYAVGSDSGSGSYGQLAEFKASIINEFVATHAVTRVMELGCGDGNQLSLAKYPFYVGLDVAPSAIERCRRRFSGDDTKSFHVLGSPQDVARLSNHAELVLSLDVIYHLVEDDVYRQHLRLLFENASRFVIIYSSDYDEVVSGSHVRHRRFSQDVTTMFPNWRLIKHIPQAYRASELGVKQGSQADFFVFHRAEADERRRVPTSDAVE